MLALVGELIRRFSHTAEAFQVWWHSPYGIIVPWSAHITENLAEPEVNDDVRIHKQVKLANGIG